VPKICLGEDGFVRIGGTLPPVRRDEVLKFAEKEGFQGIELHAMFEMYTPGVAKSTKEYYAKFGQEIPGLQTGHIGFFYPPISEDQITRDNYVNAVEDALRFDEELGATHATLTPPLFTQDMTKEYDVLLSRYIKVVEAVVARAEKYGVVMAIEPEPNLLLNGGALRDSLEDVKLILNTIKSKRLAILYDIAHVNIISHGDPVGFLKALNGRVSWVHVADNDFSLSPFGTGKHQTFGEGNVDMVALFRAMKEQVPGLDWLQIDTWEHPTPFEAASKNRTELERILREINWAK
jgi:sugar phosphate isomerase/epimerase